jgi:hypothetical protein
MNRTIATTMTASRAPRRRFELEVEDLGRPRFELRLRRRAQGLIVLGVRQGRRAHPCRELARIPGSAERSRARIVAMKRP